MPFLPAELPITRMALEIKNVDMVLFPISPQEVGHNKTPLILLLSVAKAIIG